MNKRILFITCLVLLAPTHFIAATEESSGKQKQDISITIVYDNYVPTHCTGDRAIQMFKQVYGPDFVQMGVGRTLKIEPSL